MVVLLGLLLEILYTPLIVRFLRVLAINNRFVFCLLLAAREVHRFGLFLQLFTHCSVFPKPSNSTYSGSSLARMFRFRCFAAVQLLRISIGK